MRTLLIAAVTFCTFMFQPVGCFAKGDTFGLSADISGNVRNVAANKPASVSMTIIRDESGEWRAKGEYDNKRLFGRFDVLGRTVHVGNDHVAVQFKGEITIGPEGGWDRVIKAPYVMTICLRGDDADGVYDIGEMDGYDYHQYGTMVLSSSKELLKAEIDSKAQRESKTQSESSH